MNLKTLFPALLTLLLAQPLCAQRLYIQPQVGAGISGLRGTQWGSPMTKKGLASTVGVNCGLMKGHFRTGLGISLLNTSYHNEGVYFEPAFDPATGQPTQPSYDITLNYSQVLLTLNAGYEIHIAKISVTPELSIGLAYNAISKTKRVSQETGETTKGKNSAGGFNRVPIYGRVALHFTYYLTHRLGISLTPIYSHELNGVSSPVKKSIFTPPGLFAFTGNLGVVLKI